jgi:hypothetical protein
MFTINKTLNITKICCCIHAFGLCVATLSYCYMADPLWRKNIREREREREREVAGGWIELCNEFLHNLYSSSEVINVFRWWLWWVGHAVCMEGIMTWINLTQEEDQRGAVLHSWGLSDEPPGSARVVHKVKISSTCALLGDFAWNTSPPSVLPTVWTYLMKQFWHAVCTTVGSNRLNRPAADCITQYSKCVTLCGNYVEND